MSKLELCIRCDELTGRAGKGEDSLYRGDDTGPFCEDCFDIPQQGESAKPEQYDLEHLEALDIDSRLRVLTEYAVLMKERVKHLECHTQADQVSISRECADILMNTGWQSNPWSAIRDETKNALYELNEAMEKAK